MASGPHEDHVPATLLARNLREVLGQGHHHRHPGCVVERRVEPAVHVRGDDDRLVRRSRQGPVLARAREALDPVQVEARRDGHRTLGDEVPQAPAVLEAHPEARCLLRQGALDDPHISGVAPDADRHRRTRGLCLLHDALHVARVPHLSRGEHGLKDHGFTTHVASGEVQFGAEPDPYRLDAEWARQRRRRRGPVHIPSTTRRPHVLGW